MVKLFVTGGGGFIGSHCLVELLLQNNIWNGRRIGRIVIADNLSNCVKGSTGKPVSIERVEEITGRTVEFYELDLLDKGRLGKIFYLCGPFDGVVHFAAKKSVGESWNNPLAYYGNNLEGGLNLLEIMDKNDCRNIVFSSSSTVYGKPDTFPVTEDHPRGNCTNPYGRTKFMMEEIIQDICASDPRWKGIMLRYFNPLGAHPSGMIGENPKVPRNLMPFIVKTAKGEIDELPVFGNDYDTKDGTGVRDYTHVMDVARGHVLAVKKLMEDGGKGYWTAYNFGHGEGNSVLDVVKTFEEVSGLKVPVKFEKRRKGDIPENWADHSKAKKELGWEPLKTLTDMCSDDWRWQENNPNGYQTPITSPIEAKDASEEEVIHEEEK